MLNALDINTKEIIASDKNRAALIEKAIKIVGKEGFCIRSAEPETVTLPKNWACSDGEWFN